MLECLRLAADRIACTADDPADVWRVVITECAVNLSGGDVQVGNKLADEITD